MHTGSQRFYKEKTNQFTAHYTRVTQKQTLSILYTELAHTYTHKLKKGNAKNKETINNKETIHSHLFTKIHTILLLNLIIHKNKALLHYSSTLKIEPNQVKLHNTSLTNTLTNTQLTKHTTKHKSLHKLNNTLSVIVTTGAVKRRRPGHEQQFLGYIELDSRSYKF